MENPIKVCTIDGISYPLLGGGFMDISLPHVGCDICKYAVCAKCVDLFSLNHECKHKYFDESLRRKEYICSNCVHLFNIKEENKKSKKKRNRIWSDNIHAVCVECKEHMYYDSKTHNLGDQHYCEKCKNKK
jgi:hypothetical protein